MTRLGALLIVFVATALPFAAQESAPVFDVASIKRNVGPMPRTSGTIANTPKGEIRMVWIPARLLVLLAYPVATPAEVKGLPSWADSERYDVTVKGRPDVGCWATRKGGRSGQRRDRTAAHVPLQFNNESWQHDLRRRDDHSWASIGSAARRDDSRANRRSHGPRRLLFI